MYHTKQKYVEKIIQAGMAVRLVGESGCGKSTILINAAKTAGVPYSFISGTKQTTMNHLLGFISINGEYIPTPLRTAYVEGHYFNIDEIDAMDSNVLLCLNSLENGKLAFPDGYSEPPHDNFRLTATSNPDDQHSIYTGRSKLDFATKDRFFTIELERDSNLEIHLTSNETFKEITQARHVLTNNHSTKVITMRDSIRYHKLKALDIDTKPISMLLDHDETMITEYNVNLDVQDATEEAITKNLNDVNSVDELYTLLKIKSKDLDPSS